MIRIAERGSLIIGLAAVSAGLGWLAWNFIPLDPNGQAVRVASEGAIRTLYLDTDPPAGYTGGPLPSATAAALKVLSLRFTNQPQRWALVPSGILGVIGIALIAGGTSAPPTNEAWVCRRPEVLVGSHFRKTYRVGHEIASASIE